MIVLFLRYWFKLSIKFSLKCSYRKVTFISTFILLDRFSCILHIILHVRSTSIMLNVILCLIKHQNVKETFCIGRKMSFKIVRNRYELICDFFWMIKIYLKIYFSSVSLNTNYYQIQIRVSGIIFIFIF